MPCPLTIADEEEFTAAYRKLFQLSFNADPDIAVALVTGRVRNYFSHRVDTATVGKPGVRCRFLRWVGRLAFETGACVLGKRGGERLSRRCGGGLCPPDCSRVGRRADRRACVPTYLLL